MWTHFLTAKTTDTFAIIIYRRLISPVFKGNGFTLHRTRLHTDSAFSAKFFIDTGSLLERFHRKALILGTGGASKAVNYGLKSLGLETVFVSRFKRPGTIQYEEITPEVIKEYNVIVNCTPVGMYPKVEACPRLPYEAMDSHTLLYDLIYNPDETLFLHNGAIHGATVKNGLEMLLLQAFASWEFWNGKEQK